MGFYTQFEDGYFRSRLKEFSAYYANHLSYEGVEELVERITGEKQMSDQSIQNIVVNFAKEVSKQIESEAVTVLEDETLFLPVINQEVDIYEVDTKEVLIFVDGIGVKKQSESRTSKKQYCVKSEKKINKERINSNIVLTPEKRREF